jgi:hypothetical protein
VSRSTSLPHAGAPHETDASPLPLLGGDRHGSMIGAAGTPGSANPYNRFSGVVGRLARRHNRGNRAEQTTQGMSRPRRSGPREGDNLSPVTRECVTAIRSFLWLPKTGCSPHAIEPQSLMNPRPWGRPSAVGTRTINRRAKRPACFMIAGPRPSPHEKRELLRPTEDNVLGHPPSGGTNTMSPATRRVYQMV